MNAEAALSLRWDCWQEQQAYSESFLLDSATHRCAEGFTAHPLLPVVPFLCYFPTSLLMFPRISSQINYMHLSTSQGLLLGPPQPNPLGASHLEDGFAVELKGGDAGKHRVPSKGELMALLLLSHLMCSSERRRN